MDIGVVKLAAKGQLVIPHDIRESLGLKTGDKLVVLEEDGAIVLKPARQMNAELLEEMYHLQRAAAAWKSIEQGKGEYWTLARLRREMK